MREMLTNSTRFDRISTIFLVLTGVFLIAGCQACQAPKTLVVESSVIKENRDRIHRGDAILENALQELIRQADSAMEAPVHSVMKKTAMPPSGDKHDYLSRGTYWWPDPSKPDGTPYILKDGEINPEVSKIRDFHYMRELNNGIHTLGLAYYYTKDEKYVVNALQRLRTWFLDEETRMNPNLNHSQAIPGVSDGRKEGLIDTRSFVDLIDGVQLLSTSKSFPKQDLNGLKAWFSDFMDWMTTSEIGKGAGALTNNIGTAYYMQLVDYALFTGRTAVAEKALKTDIPKLIEVQIEKDGRQPKELTRTNAWSYSVSNLNYWFRIANLAEHVNIDLWNYKTPSGRSIRSAYEWMVPYANNERTWNYKQISKTDYSRSFSTIRSRATRKYNPRSDSSRRVSKEDGVGVNTRTTDQRRTEATDTNSLNLSLSPKDLLTQGY